jgi:hypothetical protein
MKFLEHSQTKEVPRRTSGSEVEEEERGLDSRTPTLYRTPGKSRARAPVSMSHL